MVAGRQAPRVHSAISGGALDLYIIDIETGTNKRITKDQYADLQPAWSQDGKTIAFVTDRFTTDLVDLEYAGYRIGLYDVESGAFSPGPGFKAAKNINPQWSPDGKLYFVSDQNGISNVYRAAVPQGPIEQMTDVSTGISGITSLSASLSVARQSGRVMFSGREDGKYSLFSLPSDQAAVAVAAAVNESVPAPLHTEASPAAAQPAPDVLPAPRQLTLDPAELPPATRLQQQVFSDRTDPAPAPTTDTPEEYKPQMSLDNYGQGTTIAAGVDRWGAQVAGGPRSTSATCSGDRNLGIDLFAQAGSFSDVGARVAYGNYRGRINWLAGVERIPYITDGFYDVRRDIVDGRDVLVEETVLERQTSTAVFGVAARPLNRAERFEVSGSVRRLGLSVEQRRNFYDSLTGEFLGRDSEKLPGSSALNLAEVSGAFVHDTSVFAATSPIVGSRYRLEVAQTAGTVNFTTALADFRRYFMPVRPYTLAFRLLHYGRYGSGGEDRRISPLFLGYPTLVRGYESGSFINTECRPTATSTCEVFDRLLGSRMMVGNFELRFPAFGAATGQLRYGPVPLELALFADAGVAWTSAQNDTPTFLGGDRKGVASYGAAARLNLFGAAVLELDYSRPLNRPGRGWLWQFQISPGGY